jgi:hypothetical protein
MKICSKCKQEKELICFASEKRVKSGLKASCKQCDTKRVLLWHKNNRDKANAINRNYTKNNREKVCERVRKWRNLNKEYGKKKRDEYAILFPNYGKERRKNDIDNLRSPYLIAKLKRKGFTKEQIKEYPQLIEVQKILIKTKRL